MSEILRALKFVKNGYARNELVPELACFRISENRITAFNGEIAFSSPIPLDIEAAPQALGLFLCIEACGDEIQVTHSNQKLQVKSGKFKSKVPCADVSKIPKIIPRGQPIKQGDNNFLDIIGNLAKIIDVKNVRDFAKGMSFKGQSAFSTNNITILEGWTGLEMPEIVVPKKFIQEVSRYAEAPERILVDQDMIFFLYKDERWIGSKLLVDKWPNVDRILDAESDQEDIHPDFWETLKQIQPFVDHTARIKLCDGRITTYGGETEIECENLPAPKGTYNANYLLLSEKIMQQADFTRYPDPVMFKGNGGMIRGAFIGCS